VGDEDAKYLDRARSEWTRIPQGLRKSHAGNAIDFCPRRSDTDPQEYLDHAAPRCQIIKSTDTKKLLN